MVTGIILAVAVVDILDILIEIFLGIASKKFKVRADEKEILARSELPGNNCGGCSYAGCDAPAEAIAIGQAGVEACPVGGAPVAEKIGETMGVAGGTAEKKVAFVKCTGTCDKTRVQYNYYGVDDCKKVSVVPGVGEEACAYGCVGYDSCVEACAFDAIHVVDGVAVVDKKKCVACGMCMASCPSHLIELVPYKTERLARCSSHDEGKDVKAVCVAGYIGYILCTKQCEFDAIHMENSLAVIDYEKCTNCGRRVERRPVKAIVQKG